MPAGPAPTTARSTGSVGQLRHAPVACASSRRQGLTSRVPLVHSTTGVRLGDPPPASTFFPPTVAESYHVKGRKFLNRNSRTSVVSRHFPAPTTLTPSTPDSVRRRRRS